MTRSSRIRHATAAALAAVAALVGLVPAASAHVKWFSRFSYADAPRAFADVLSARVLALAVLAAAAIGGLVVLDRRIEEMAPFRRLARWLETRRDAAAFLEIAGNDLNDTRFLRAAEELRSAMTSLQNANAAIPSANAFDKNDDDENHDDARAQLEIGAREIKAAYEAEKRATAIMAAF